MNYSFTAFFFCAAAAADMIVISDDEEAVVRLVQVEEDEALARSLQVGGCFS